MWVHIIEQLTVYLESSEVSNSNVQLITCITAMLNRPRMRSNQGAPEGLSLRLEKSVRDVELFSTLSRGPKPS